MVKKIIIALWAFFFLLIGIVAWTFYAIENGTIGNMPNLHQLQNPVDKYATQVFSADGKLIGTWSYSSANRVSAHYNEISPWVVKALIATEDVRFYQHSGIDFRALMRALIKRGFMGQEAAGGGSTITQQLAKQLYSERAQSKLERVMQKPIEWVVACKLERLYTKEEIIEMYLSYFDFLHNAVGIKTASRTYFDKDPSELTITESAMLIGMCKNPSYFNPVRKPERTLGRRNVVLDQMVKAGYLDADSAVFYKGLPLALNYHTVDHKQGAGTYLREHLRQLLMARRPMRHEYASWQGQKYYDDSVAWETDPLYGWCNKNVRKDGSHYNIYEDGLKIYTTIDSRMQSYAEEAMRQHVAGTLQPAFEREGKGNRNWPYDRERTQEEVRKFMRRSMRQSERYLRMKSYNATDEAIERAFNTPVEMTVYSPHGDIDTTMSPLDSIRYYKSFLRSGFMAMDPYTGHVKAYVGGLDFTHFQYDMASVGRRQVGSTIKPYLYALAMENGMSPCDEAPNVQQTYYTEGGDPWTPRNGSRARYGEMVTLRWGLQQSNNWISAYLMSKLRPANLVEMLYSFGITNRSIVPSMSLCLGPCDISVQEMVSAYTAFVARGIRAAPLYVTRIVDSDGTTLAEFQPRVNEVLSEDASYKMLDLLQAVMNGGTGSRMRFKYNMHSPMGGKTGTTNSNSDGWFMCFTPQLVTGCWVGGEERDIHFSSMANGQGAAAALPVTALFMQKIFSDARLGMDPTMEFNIPEGFDPCNSTYDGSGYIDNIDESGVHDIFQ